MRTRTRDDDARLRTHTHNFMMNRIYEFYALSEAWAERFNNSRQRSKANVKVFESVLKACGTFLGAFEFF